MLCVSRMCWCVSVNIARRPPLILSSVGVAIQQKKVSWRGGGGSWHFRPWTMGKICESPPYFAWVRKLFIDRTGSDLQATFERYMLCRFRCDRSQPSGPLRLPKPFCQRTPMTVFLSIPPSQAKLPVMCCRSKALRWNMRRDWTVKQGLTAWGLSVGFAVVSYLHTFTHHRRGSCTTCGTRQLCKCATFSVSYCAIVLHYE